MSSNHDAHRKEVPAESDALRPGVTQPEIPQCFGAPVQESSTRREEELSLVYDNAPAIMLLINRDGTIRRANRAAREQNGEGGSDVVGMRGGDALRCINALSQSRGCGFGPVCEECVVRNMVVDTLGNGKSYHKVEHWMELDHGGKRVQAHTVISSVALFTAEDRLALVTIEDITEQKRAEEALRENELLFKALFNSVNDVVWVAMPDGSKFRYINPVAEAVYGRSVEELYANPDFWLSMATQRIGGMWKSQKIYFSREEVVP